MNPGKHVFSQKQSARHTTGRQPGAPHRPGVAQPKMAAIPHLKKQPVAPPVYRPQPAPKAVQPKLANAAQNRAPRTAPPVYRPEVKKFVQPKMAAAAQAPRPTKAPPVYRPQSIPKVLQTKKSQTMAVAPAQRPATPQLPARARIGAQQVSRIGAQQPGKNGRPNVAGPVQLKLAPARIALQSRTIQLVRPDTGMTVIFEGKEWIVTGKSSEDNPNVSLKDSGGKTRNMNWQTEVFTLHRPNTENDYDMRGQGSGAGVITAAKEKALEMMKAYILEHGKPVSTPNKFTLNALTVASFAATATKDPVNGQDAEWDCTWAQGKTRTWTLVIDMDRPLSTSTQDPHVGWTLSATAPKKGFEVRNVFGHVWVDDVPASRQ